MTAAGAERDSPGDASDAEVEGPGAGPGRVDEAARPRARRLAVGALRVLVTAGLIYWIVRSVDWAEFWRTLLETDLVYLGLSLAVAPVLIVVSAWKWKILLRALSFPAGLGTCFHLYLVGIFFNNFLPTQVGGDVVRGVLLGKRFGRTAGVLASVVAERVTGLVALIALAVLVVAYDRGRVFPDLVVWGVLAAAVSLAVAIWLMLDPRVLALARRKAHLPLVDKLARFQAALQEYRDRRRALVVCLGLSFVFYLFAAVNVLVSARAFHVPLDPVQAVVATPIILVIMLFPISLGGIGLMEWAYIFVLGKYGATPAASLSTSLLMRAKGVGFGLLGGLAYLIRFDLPLRSLVAVGRRVPTGPDVST